jgi:uncharacterized protein (TIGR02145 family)
MGSHLCFVIPKKYTMVFRILTFLLLPMICLAQINSNGEKPKGELLSNEVSPIEMKRNASFNVDEIKVRWKKAALENCSGVPCVVTPPAPSFTCGTSTVSDYDGNVYETVSIVGSGVTQCWTKSNLKVTKYNDGTLIPEITSTGAWNFTIVTGARTVYNDLPANLSAYGYLYNWYAAVGIITNMGSPTKNICPTDWHVPTDAEWTTMIQALVPNESLITSPNTGGPQSSTAGNLMKSAVTSPTTSFGWLGSPATNTSGFSGLPGGFRSPDNNFYSSTFIGNFWSATDYVFGLGSYAWLRALYFNAANVNRLYEFKQDGASVRCLKD